MDPNKILKCKVGEALSPEWSVEEVVAWAERSFPVKVRPFYGSVNNFLSNKAIICKVPTFGKNEALEREAGIIEDKDELYKTCAVEIFECGMVLYVAGRELDLVGVGGYGTIEVFWTEHDPIAIECINPNPERAFNPKATIFYSKSTCLGIEGPQEIIMTYDEKNGHEIVQRFSKLTGGYVNPSQLLTQRFAPRDAFGFL